MNIGLECLRPAKTSQPVASLEQVMSNYVDCEQFVASTERFCAYGDALFDAFDNVMSIGRTAAKFGSNESLAVLNELVGHEFGGSLEAEEVKSTAKSIWQKIGEFFQKIWSWIRNFFAKIFNFFKPAESRLDAYIAKLKAAEGKGTIKPFTYKAYMISFTTGNIPVAEKAAIVTTVAAKLSSANAEGQLKDLADGIISKAKESSLGCNTLAEALKKAEAMKLAFGDIKNAKTSVEKLYNDEKAKVERAKKMQNEQGLKEARFAQKKMATAVKVVNKLCALKMRSISSFLSNATLPTEEKAAPAAK